jgi:hypothetical protein
MDNVTQFPVAEPEPWHFPISEGDHVVIDGRLIPKMRVWERGDEVTITLDGRFAIDVPKALGRQVAWIVAEAMAIGAGYSNLAAESKDCPFAPQMTRLAELPQ